MSPLKPYPVVVVGTDGSQTATEAVRRAARYAGALEVPLLVATAYGRTHPADLGPPSERAEMPGEAWMSAAYRAAADIVNEAAQVAEKAAPGVAVDTATPEGHPAEELLGLAAVNPGCLLAVGSQGMTRSSRFLLGSVPNRVSHHAVGDVLIVRTGEGRPETLPSQIVVGYDGSDRSKLALRRAFGLGEVAGAAVMVVTVTDDAGVGERRLAEATAIGNEFGVAVDGRILGGDPADRLVEASAAADLVVVGNRGMTGASRFLIGSVPNKVSHHVNRDLLIVKTND